MNSQLQQFYNPSLTTRALKKVVSLSSHMLPSTFYNQFYDFSFSSYRLLLRLSYSRHLIFASSKNRRESQKKASTILKVMPYSLVGTGGLEVTYDAAYDIERSAIKGSVVECGVAQGGSAALMSIVASQHGNQRNIWLFDSYEGLPDPTEEDYVGGKTGIHVRDLPRGSCLGAQEQVEDLLFNHFHLDRKKIKLVKGWFEETLAPNVSSIGPIALLRIDADWYESVKCCLDNLYDLVVPSGYVIIDDYGSCFGAHKAVDEFLEARHIKVELFPDGRGGCYFVKPNQAE